MWGKVRGAYYLRRNKWNSDPEAVRDTWDEEEVMKILYETRPDTSLEQKRHTVGIVKKIWQKAKDEQDQKWKEKGV